MRRVMQYDARREWGKGGEKHRSALSECVSTPRPPSLLLFTRPHSSSACLAGDHRSLGR